MERADGWTSSLQLREVGGWTLAPSLGGIVLELYFRS